MPQLHSLVGISASRSCPALGSLVCLTPRRRHHVLAQSPVVCSAQSVPSVLATFVHAFHWFFACANPAAAAAAPVPLCRVVCWYHAGRPVSALALWKHYIAEPTRPRPRIPKPSDT